MTAYTRARGRGADAASRGHRSAPARVCALLITMMACSLMFGSAPDHTHAATSNVTVTATIPSVTSLDTSQCADHTANVTDFGTVLPGSNAVTSTDCTLTWGSTNDTSMLRLSQPDGAGRTMYQPASTLDTGFSGDGTAALDLGGTERFLNVTTQLDGKSVSVGTNGADFLVARFNSDGTLDTAGFNAPNGYVITSVSAGNDKAQSVTVDGSGRIIVAGVDGSYKHVVARYSSTGVLDTAAFNAPTGFQTITPPWLSSNATSGSVIVQPDGNILVGGNNYGPLIEEDFTFIRLLPTGALDTTFDGNTGTGNGLVQYDSGMGGGGQNQYMGDMVLNPDGTIIAAGTGHDGINFNVNIVKLLADGRIDTSFATSGWIDGNFTAQQDWGYGLALQPNGKFLLFATAYTNAPTYADAIVARYNANGTLDTAAFNAPLGYRLWNYVPDMDDDYAFDGVVQADGRILVAGGHYTTANRLMLFRLNSDGTDDTTFGTNGVIFDTAYTYFSWNMPIVRISEGSDGTTHIAGGSTGAGNGLVSQMVAAGSISDYQTGVNTWSIGTTGMFGICLRAVSGTGVLADWTVNATCPASDGAWWNPVPLSASLGTAKVAESTVSATSTATARLRFGLRVPSNQKPGTYSASIIVQVVAPNV